MRSVVRNLSWLLISQLSTWGVSMVILVIAPRELGDRAYGQLAFAITFVSFFELLALFGTGTYLVKTVARDPDDVGRYVVNGLLMSFLMAVVLGCAAIGLATALGYSDLLVMLIAIYALGMVLVVVNTPLMSGLFGMQRMGPPAFWGAVRSYAGAALGIPVLLRGGSTLEYALVFSIVAVIPLVANLVTLWPKVRRHWMIEPGLWKQILVGGFPFFITSGLLMIYGRIDIPMLHAFSDSQTVGWYSVAYQWVSMPAFFASIVATAFFPVLSAQGITISESFTRMANRAIRLVVFVGAPCAIGIALISQDLVTLLYGAEFQQSVPLIRLLALHIPIVGLDIVLGAVVVAADRQRQWVVVSVAAAIFNPLANLIAIPLAEHAFGNGAIGSSTVTILTEVLIMAGALVLRPAGVMDRATTSQLLRTTIASAVMVPVVLALDGQMVAVKIAAGAVSYGIASFLLRTISPEEVRLWRRELLGRGRDRVGVVP